MGALVVYMQGKIKTLRKHLPQKSFFFEGENNQNMINHEVSIMARNSHPTIVKFYGYSLTDFNGDERVTLLMQLASKCSLDSMMNHTIILFGKRFSLVLHVA